MNPYLVLIIGTAFAATSGVFVKKLGLLTTSVAFFRFIVPLLFTFIFLRYKKIKLFTGNYKIMLLASTFNAIRMFFYLAAFMYTSLTNSIIILFTWPIFAAIFGIFILKEKVTKRQIFLFALAFFGIIIMNIGQEFSFQNKDMIGMGSMLISSLVLALTNVYFKKAIDGYSNYETIFYQNLIGGIVFLPFIFINLPLPSIEQFSVGIFYGLFIGVFVFYLFFSVLRKMKMAQYSLMKYFEVLFSITYGVLFFGDTLSLKIFIGGGMIVLSGILLKKK